jgi:hypothetical protein
VFWLALDCKHNVLLARFDGMLVPEDIRDLDEAVRRFVRTHGYVRGLLDFTDISLVAVPESFFWERSRLPLISAGQNRVFVAPQEVAPQEEVFVLVRRYANQQRDFGPPTGCRDNHDASALKACARIPTRIRQLDAQTELYSYEIHYERTGGVEITLPIIGGGFSAGGSGSYCHALVRIVGGKAAGVAYTGDNDDMIGPARAAQIPRGAHRTEIGLT